MRSVLSATPNIFHKQQSQIDLVRLVELEVHDGINCGCSAPP